MGGGREENKKLFSYPRSDTPLGEGLKQKQKTKKKPEKGMGGEKNKTAILKLLIICPQIQLVQMVEVLSVPSARERTGVRVTGVF